MTHPSRHGAKSLGIDPAASPPLGWSWKLPPPGSSGRREEPSPATFPHPVAVSPDVEDVAMVQKSVGNGRRDHAISADLSAFPETLVGCSEDAAAFAPGRDQLEQWNRAVAATRSCGRTPNASHYADVGTVRCVRLLPAYRRPSGARRHLRRRVARCRGGVEPAPVATDRDGLAVHPVACRQPAHFSQTDRSDDRRMAAAAGGGIADVPTPRVPRPAPAADPLADAIPADCGAARTGSTAPAAEAPPPGSRDRADLGGPFPQARSGDDVGPREEVKPRADLQGTEFCYTQCPFAKAGGGVPRPGTGWPPSCPSWRGPV